MSQSWCCADVKTAGVAVVAVKALTDAVKALPAGAVVELIEASDHLQIRAGKQYFRLPTTDTGDYPVIPAAPASSLTRVKHADVAALVQRVAHAVTRSSDVRYALQGGKVEIAAGTFRIVATDAHRLAHASIDTIHSGELDGIVPVHALGQLRRLDDAGKGPEGGVVIRSDENECVFFEVHRAGRHIRTVATRLIDGQFPKWEKVMPGPMPWRVEFDAADGLKALTSVGKFAPRSGGIELVGGYGECTFKTSNPEVGETGHAVPSGGNFVEANMAPFLNGRYLMDFLKVLPTGARVAFGVQEDKGKGDTTSQMLVWPVDTDEDVSSKYVIMPMRR